MPFAGGGFEQSYNAQGAVATGSLLVVETNVTQAANYEQQMTPMLIFCCIKSRLLTELAALIALTTSCLTCRGK
jgi:hypothetical protein